MVFVALALGAWRRSATTAAARIVALEAARVIVTVVSSPERLGAASAVLFILMMIGRTTPVLAPDANSRCSAGHQSKCRTESKGIVRIPRPDRCVVGD